jgi:hypothetical protein
MWGMCIFVWYMQNSGSMNVSENGISVIRELLIEQDMISANKNYSKSMDQEMEIAEGEEGPSVNSSILRLNGVRRETSLTEEEIRARLNTLTTILNGDKVCICNIFMYF